MQQFLSVSYGYVLLQRYYPPHCHNPKYAHKYVPYQRPVPDFEITILQYQIPFWQDQHAYWQKNRQRSK